MGRLTREDFDLAAREITDEVKACVLAHVPLTTCRARCIERVGCIDHVAEAFDCYIPDETEYEAIAQQIYTDGHRQAGYLGYVMI